MATHKAHGSIFKWHNGTILVAVPQIRNLNGPDESIDVADTTNMDTVGGKRTFIPTLVNSGTISLEIEYDPDDVAHTSLITDAEAKTSRAFEITETDPTPKTKAGTGIITAVSFARDFSGVLMMNVSIQVTGAITHA